MDGVGLRLLRHPDDLVDGKIGFDRAFALADLIGLVRLEAMERELVLLGIDRDGGDAQFRRGPEHPDRDLGAVGHQKAAEGRGHR